MVAVMVAVIALGPEVRTPDVAGAATRVAGADPCTLVEAVQVEAALGVEGRHVAGPERLADGCTWHSADPACTMRAFGIQVVSGSDAELGFHAAKGVTAAVDLPALGTAFSSADILPALSGAQVERLEVLRPGLWLRFTASGRLGDGGRDVLSRVASQVLQDTGLQ